MDKHLTVCTKRNSRNPLNRQKSEADAELAVERLSLIEENLTSLRKSLNEEIQMRLEMIGEFGSLKRRNQVMTTKMMMNGVFTEIHVSHCR